MSNPQNPAIHPELGPANLVRQPVSGPIPIAGEIIFNEGSLQSGDPRQVIAAESKAHTLKDCQRKASEAIFEPLQK
ncbi:MAG: hypothetical protein NUV73_01625 [Candidatus Daviesbacteria bacterium]|nr:hypothetical protein [Candidatus Daviesbacteria bacterium]